jgi:hypothetical protein
MASTPVILLLKRTGNSADRPDTATVQTGEAALSFGGAEPGMYFKDSAGAIRKVGPTFYGNNAPNSSPVGSAGNSVGELWVDSSSSAYYMKVWNGASWQKVGSAFADTAASATVTIASGAIVANSAIIASGSLGAVSSSGSLGAVSSSGSLEANLASGINVVGALPAAYTGGVVYLNAGVSGLYVSANGGWILI